VSDDDFLRVEANDCPMSSCAARRVTMPDRQGQGDRAVPYRPVPASAASGEGARRPGPASAQAGLGLAQLSRPSAADAVPAGHVRIGYACASTVRQSLDT
jgi:hypothetical protein